MSSESVLRQRVAAILTQLGLMKPTILECVMVLLDDRTPSPFPALAKAGHPFSSGGRTRHILDAIAGRLGSGKIDREMRDYIQLPLREVGILRKGYADGGAASVVMDKWVPKSASNVYLVDPDFRAMIELESEAKFERASRKWLAGRDERLARIRSAEARQAAADTDRLVPGTLEMYCPWYLPDFEVVFVDDADGTRIDPQWQGEVDRLNIPLDLESRWPDIILNIPATNRCWIVDCVENDGEVDPVRRQEMIQHFEDRGLAIDGFTTVYRTMRRFADRQALMDNIAPQTHVWVMEIGGGQWLKLPPPPAQP